MNYSREGLLYKVSKKIIDFRIIIILLFISLTVFGLVMFNKANVTSDISIFLPDTTETKQGYYIMKDEFAAYGSANFIFLNIEYDTAEKIANDIASFPYVLNVSFDNTELHYNNASANIAVTFTGQGTDENVITTYRNIKEKYKNYDLTTYTTIDNRYLDKLAKEMGPIIIAVAIFLIVILILTTNSYVIMIICMLMFVIAAILNVGTNFILPYVSSITSSIGIVLQIAISVDYSIILCKKIEEELKTSDNYKDAVAMALSKTIVEITSSSLTTIAGLICLCLMQFKLGYDMGIVLAKGVFFSLITVIFLMPSLIYTLRKPIEKTKHKTIIPKIKKLSKMVINTKCVFAIIFALLIPFSIVFANSVHYSYSDVDVNELVPSENRSAMHILYENFGYETTVAILVPGGDYEAEKEIVNRIKEIDKVKSVLSIASIEIKDGIVLSDSINSRQFAEVLDIDYEVASVLYMAYGVEDSNYSSIFTDANDYKVPLYKMLDYAFKKIDEGFVKLTPNLENLVNSYRPIFDNIIGQLIGPVHDRIAVNFNIKESDPEAIKKVDQIKEIASEYYTERVYTFGEITAANDSLSTYFVDKELIAILTIVVIFIIVFLSFKSIFASVLLILVIQGSIWINFSITYLCGNTPLFVTGMIVTAIQMGATIDYAIVLYNRYLNAKNAGLEKTQAMMRAMGDSFATIFISGFIFVAVGFLVGLGIDDVYVNHVGLMVGQGAAISFILVFSALPQLILIFDKWIEKTTFKKKIFNKIKDEIIEEVTNTGKEKEINENGK